MNYFEFFNENYSKSWNFFWKNFAAMKLFYNFCVKVWKIAKNAQFFSKCFHAAMWKFCGFQGFWICFYFLRGYGVCWQFAGQFRTMCKGGWSRKSKNTVNKYCSYAAALYIDPSPIGFWVNWVNTYIVPSIGLLS